MQPQIPNYTFFPCPYCGQQVPGNVPAGVQFPCPWCKNMVVAPQASVQQMAVAAAHVQYALQHGATDAALANAHTQTDPRRAHFSLNSQQVLIRDAGRRYLVVGSHVDASRKWCLRALDAQRGDRVWETQRVFDFGTCPGTQQMGSRDGLLLLFLPGVAWGIDAASGQIRWQVGIQGTVQTVSGLPDGDQMALEYADGVAVVRTEDSYRNEHIIAIDGNGGQILWHRQGDQKVQPAGNGLLLIKHDDGAEVVQLRTGQTVSQVRGDFSDPQVVGPYVAVKASGYGPTGDNGMLLADPATGNPVAFLPSEDIVVGHWDDDAARMLGRHVVAKADTGDGGRLLVIDPQQPPPKPGFFAKLLGTAKAGYEARRIPGPNYSFGKIAVSQDAICLQAGTWDGDDYRFFVIDPQSLQIRHDSGPLPFEESDSYFEAFGTFAAYVIPTDEDRNQRELRVVETTTGRPLWSRPIGDWSSHWFTPEGLLVVYHDADIDVFDPAGGQLVAGYPMPR